VIPPAGEERPDPATPASFPSNGQHLASTPGGTIDLDSFIDGKLRPLAKQKQQKYDALLNGSCRVVSYEAGVLTLGFFQDAHHKKTVEESSTRKVYEALAAQIFGEPVEIRCILVEKTAKVIKSALVAHAVQAHGAKIVSGHEES
jgi:hypothetical protein